MLMELRNLKKKAITKPTPAINEISLRTVESSFMEESTLAEI